MSDEFICELLAPKDIDSAGKILVDAFLEQNAMYRTMKFTFTDLYPFIAQVLPICISEGSAFSCKNNSLGNLAEFTGQHLKIQCLEHTVAFGEDSGKRYDQYDQ